MNKNKTESEETVDAVKEKDTDTEQTPHSAMFKDLYDDLLNTLNTPVRSKSGESKENQDSKDKENKSASDTSPGENITNRDNIGAPARNTNLSELFDIINSQAKKPESSKPANTPNNVSNASVPAAKKDAPSSDNSFKDNILNSEIFDSVVNDLNKQKEEMVEKKKERDNRAKSASATVSPPVKEYIPQEKPDSQPVKISETTEEQEDIKVYKPPVKNAESSNTAKNIKNIKKSETDEDNENIRQVKSEVQTENISVPIEEPEPEDQEDEELLKAFGISYEDENDIISDGVKSKKAKAKSAKSKPKLKSIHQVLNGEYVTPEQNKTVFEGYKKIFTKEWIKFLVSTVLLLILAYMEIAPQFKLPLPYFIDPAYYNAAYILFDLQILLVVVWLNADSLLFGIKSIFASVVNIYYISVFFVLLTFLHTMATYFWRFNAQLWVENDKLNMILFNSITVFGLVLVSVYNLLDMNIEIMAFKVISTKKPKYAIRLNDKSTLEMDEFRDIIPENSIVGNISKTTFISNFFSRINKKKIYSTQEKYFLAISASVAIVLFAVLLGFKIDKYIALSAAITVVLSSVPFCAVIVNIFPLYKAQKGAYNMASAIIGAESVNDHSEVSIISVFDRDIFPPDQAKISSFKIYGNSNRLETVLQHFCAIFEKLNMSVADGFKATTTYEPNFNKHVDILSIAENGVCFISNGRKLFLGNSEYISNIGLTVNYDQNFDEQFLKSSGSILFLSSDSELIVKIYIKYEIVSEFFDIIKNLNKANICLGIRTFDPNIDNTLLQKFVNFKRFPVKVIKLKDPKEVYEMPEHMDSGVVSKSSLKSLVRTLLLCNKAKQTRKSNAMLQIIAFLIGIGITSLAIVLGIINGDIWTINPGYILLFHGFWMFPIIFLSGLTPT